jgi:hypothetical protein
MCENHTPNATSDNRCHVNVVNYHTTLSGVPGEKGSQPTTLSALAARFWAKVDRRSDNECWPWLGDLGTRGYGQINVDGKNVGAHRIAHWLATGEEIVGFIVRHFVCDNPPCCNPAHLKRGTQKDNVQDAIRKGRHVHPNWRLRKHHRNGHTGKAA